MHFLLDIFATVISEQFLSGFSSFLLAKVIIIVFSDVALTFSSKMFRRLFEFQILFFLRLQLDDISSVHQCIILALYSSTIDQKVFAHVFDVYITEQCSNHCTLRICFRDPNAIIFNVDLNIFRILSKTKFLIRGTVSSRDPRNEKKIM